MKFSTVFAATASLSAASASIVARQAFTDLPGCALTCALGSLGQTNCQPTDIACICGAQSFVAGLLPCVRSGCSDTELADTIRVATGFCQAAGVSLDVGAITGAPTAAPSTTGPSSVVPTTSADTTSAPPMTDMSSSAPVPAPSSNSSTTAGPNGNGNGSGSGSGTGNGTFTTTGAPSATQSQPGAASRNGVAMGGLAVIIALVATLL